MFRIKNRLILIKRRAVIHLLRLSTCLVFFTTNRAVAQVYNCDGIWSTKPCSEEAQPIQLKRQLSISGDTSPRTSEGSNQKPDSKSELSDIEVVPVCKVASDGVSITISDASVLVRESGNSVSAIFRLLIRNQSKHHTPRTPISVAVETSSGKRFYEEVTAPLGPGLSTKVSFSKHESRQNGTYLKRDSFQISLIYEPAAACKEISVKGKLDHEDRNSGTFASAADIKASLLRLRAEVKEELKNRLGSTRYNDAKRAAEQRYNLALLGLCGAGTRNLRNGAIDSLCIEIGELVKKICD